jgi:hypothetical protein
MKWTNFQPFQMVRLCRIRSILESSLAASLRPRVGQSFALGAAELAAQVARDPRESRRPGHGTLQMAAVNHRNDQNEANDDPKS